MLRVLLFVIAASIVVVEPALAKEPKGEIPAGGKNEKKKKKEGSNDSEKSAPKPADADEGTRK